LICKIGLLMRLLCSQKIKSKCLAAIKQV